MVFIVSTSHLRLHKQSLYSKKPLLLGTTSNEGYWVLVFMNKFLKIFPLRL